MLVMARRIEGRKPITRGCWDSTDWRSSSVIWVEVDVEVEGVGVD